MTSRPLLSTGVSKRRHHCPCQTIAQPPGLPAPALQRERAVVHHTKARRGTRIAPTRVARLCSRRGEEMLNDRRYNGATIGDYYSNAAQRIRAEIMERDDDYV